MDILFIDVETTGQDPRKHSIIQLAAEFYSNDKLVSSFNKFVEHVGEINLGALKYNKFKIRDIRGLIKKGVSEEEAAIDFVEFLLNLKSEKPIIIGGHNCAFDLNFINEFLYRNNFEGLNNLVSYRVLDTSTIAGFLKETNFINLDKISLENLVNYFDCKPDVLNNISSEERFHDAAFDVKCTANLYFTLRNFLKR